MSIVKILFSFHGRIPRSTFWAATLGTFFSYGILAAILALTLSEHRIGGIGGPEVLIILVITMCWIGFAIQVKRWHDMGYSGWMILLSIVATLIYNVTAFGGILTACIFLWLGLAKGTVGANKYGPDPLQAAVVVDQNEPEESLPVYESQQNELTSRAAASTFAEKVDQKESGDSHPITPMPEEGLKNSIE